MVTYTLTVQSTPTGVEHQVKVGTTSFWIVTSKTLTYDSGTVVEVLAPDTVGQPVGTTQLGWKFVKWTITPEGESPTESTDRLQTITLTKNYTIASTFEQQQYYPTRHYTKRKNKFQGKVDEEVYSSRTTALKTMMVTQQEVTTAQQTRIESIVGDYCHAQGFYGIELHHYRNFSMELWGLTRIFKAATLNKEASEKAKKWKSRGLSQTHLDAIAKLFGITITWT